jgi:hypothetical protein
MWPTDRPLDDLKEFSARIATDINDLPQTSPHGSDFGDHTEILGLALNPNMTSGTAKAHLDQCANTQFKRLDVRC